MANNYEEISPILISELSKIEKKQKAFSKLLKEFNALKTQNCYNVYKWATKNKEILVNEFEDYNDVVLELKKICENNSLLLDSEFKDKIQDQGFRLDGAWPNYYINHILAVVFDQKKLSMKIGDNIPIPIDINEAIKEIKTTLSPLRADITLLNEFLFRIYKSYLKFSNNYDTISIWTIYQDIIITTQSKKFWTTGETINFKPLSILEFTYMITELLKQNILVVSGYHLRLLPPLSDESIFLYQPVENRFSNVGRLQFVKIGE